MRKICFIVVKKKYSGNAKKWKYAFYFINIFQDFIYKYNVYNKLACVQYIGILISCDFEKVYIDML